MWISAGSSSDKIVGCTQATRRMLRMTKFLMNMLQSFGPSFVLVHPHETPATAGLGSDAAWLRKASLSVSTMGACSIDNVWHCGWRIGARASCLGTAKDEVLAFNVRPRSGASVRTRWWFVLWVWAITKTGGTLWAGADATWRFECRSLVNQYMRPISLLIFLSWLALP